VHQGDFVMFIPMVQSTLDPKKKKKKLQIQQGFFKKKWGKVVIF
jgi:hypothetical protein